MTSLSQDALSGKMSRRKRRGKVASPVDPSVPPLRNLIEKLKRAGQLRYAMTECHTSAALPQRNGGPQDV